MLGTQIGAYQNVQASTADPATVVLLLFDGAMRFLRQAQRGLERKDAAQFAQSVSRAHAIIAELSESLDHEMGGAIADNLARLYGFMLGHLTQGLIARSAGHLEDVLKILHTLRDGFEGAVAAHRRESRG
jgi:flagellar protein FliS